MFNRFTERARNTMSEARRAALEHDHDYIGPEHMLLGLLAQTDGAAMGVLKLLGVRVDQLRAGVVARMRRGRKPSPAGQLPFTPKAKVALEIALSEAQSLGHTYIGTEHLLVGVICAQATVTEPALAEAGVGLGDVRLRVIEILGMSAPQDSRQVRTVPTPGTPWSRLMSRALRESDRDPPAPEHLLLALLEDDGPAGRILRELGASRERVTARLLELRSEQPPAGG